MPNDLLILLGLKGFAAILYSLFFVFPLLYIIKGNDNNSLENVIDTM